MSMRLYCNVRAIVQNRITSGLNEAAYSRIVKSEVTHIASLVGFFCPAFGTSEVALARQTKNCFCTTVIGPIINA